MQTPGTYISALGHVGLVSWLILGWGFDAEPLPMQTIDVAVVSGEEFEALMRPAQTPLPGSAAPDAPVQPQAEPAPDAVAAQDDPAVTAFLPDPVAAPEAEVPPPPPPPAAPQAEVADAPPPEPAPPAPTPPPADLNVADRPVPRQAPTVAPLPAAPPPPDAQVDEVVREEAVPDETAPPELVEEEQVATAPPEATDQIVIEDQTPSGAVETSMRPTARPSRPTPPAAAPSEDAQVAETAPSEPDEESGADVEAALAAALAAASAADAPDVAAGPPMTGSEKDAFRVAVNSCWIVDPGSPAARVTVDVGFRLDRNGTVQGDVRLISSDGEQSATNIAFETARRAILRCQRGGYDLPADKYDQWKDVVITFDPSGMRMR